MFGTTVSGTFDAAVPDDDTGRLPASFRIRRIMAVNCLYLSRRFIKVNFNRNIFSSFRQKVYKVFVDIRQKKLYNIYAEMFRNSLLLIGEVLAMIKGYEIERKFLVAYPSIEELDVKRKISITQTYLTNGENSAQRRVRKLTENGDTIYTYTEKLFITAVTRQEMEYEIDRKEYDRLIVQARDDCKPINKVRYCFEYSGQLFELDTYPFSDSLAIMEIELGSPEQPVDLPDNVTVIKEVTGDPSYSNAAIATAEEFPEDAAAEGR